MQDGSSWGRRGRTRRRTLREEAGMGLDLSLRLLVSPEAQQRLGPSPVGSAMIRSDADDLEEPPLRLLVVSARQVDRGNLVERVDTRLLLGCVRGSERQDLFVGLVCFRTAAEELQ